MYRMMIVDDEERIVNSIYDLMEDQFDFELYRCTSALQALAEIRRIRFDIIISDIAMPQVNGFELAEEVLKIWPKCHFLMLTAYNSFEYAYQALKYDRVDYLLKVESYDRICEVIAKKRMLIEQERRQEERLQDFDRNLQQLNQSMRDYFLKRIVVMGTPLPDQSDLDAIALFIRLNDPVFLVLAGTDSCSPVDHRRAADIVEEWVSAQLEQHGLQGFTYTSAASHNILFIIQGSADTQHTPEALTVYIHMLFDHLAPMVEEQVGLRLAVLCPDRFIRWEQIHALYQRCVIRMEKLRSESGMEMIMVDQELNQQHAGFNFPNIDEIMLLWEMIKNKNLSGFRTAMEQGLGELCSTQNTQSLRTHTSVIATGYLLTETAKLYASEYLQQETFKKTAYNVEKYASGRQWLEDVFSVVESILASNKAAKVNKGAWLVQCVNQYMEQHYAEDITLTALADQMHYSPSYLSRYYKSNAGVNVMNHLYDIRILKARQMLSQTSMKINEIAEKTGFCSTRYFNRVFKKSTGITPAQFRASATLPHPEVER